MPVCLYSSTNLNFFRWSAPAENFQKFFWRPAAPPSAGLFSKVTALNQITGNK